MSDQFPTTSQHPIPSILVQEDPCYADIVEDFVHGLNQRLEDISQALRAKNFETLRAKAHQLKGAGGGYGYPVLTEKAAELERLAIRQTVSDCESALKELAQLCSRLVIGNDGV